MSTMTQARPIDRTTAQRARALELANETRFLRAAMKKDLKAGTVTVSELIEAPPDWLLTMKVARLLAAIPRFGVMRTRRLLTLARVSEGKTVGGLSDRQRREIVALLRDRGVE